MQNNQELYQQFIEKYNDTLPELGKIDDLLLFKQQLVQELKENFSKEKFMLLCNVAVLLYIKEGHKEDIDDKKDGLYGCFSAEDGCFIAVTHASNRYEANLSLISLLLNANYVKYIDKGDIDSFVDAGQFCDNRFNLGENSPFISNDYDHIKNFLGIQDVLIEKPVVSFFLGLIIYSAYIGKSFCLKKTEDCYDFNNNLLFFSNTEDCYDFNKI